MATQLKPGDGAAYETDVVGWADAQVAALLARRPDLLDWDNLAEEVGDVGKNQADALGSAIVLVLLHLLKWDFQPGRRSRSWVNSIGAHRGRAARLLRRAPSLKSRLPEILEEEYLIARRFAAAEMDIPTRDLPADSPYDWDTLMTRPIAWDGEEA